MIALGASIVATTTAIAAPVGFAVKTFAEFDDAMRAVGAVAQTTAAELAMLTHTAERLGETTSFTAMEVAALMQELGRAGFDATEIDRMTSSVLSLSRATGTDATLSAEILSSSIRQFGLAAGDAGRVADVLTGAANKTSVSVGSLGESLSYAGPVARELGMSLEDTVAILGTLGNAGIRGSEAGTALRRLGVISAATGEKLKAIFDINNIDAAGNMKPLVQILSEIGRVVENLPVAERVAKMNEAFGLLGITSASAMARASIATQQLAEDLKKSAGAAEESAKAMDAGLGGAVRILMSALEGLELALGQVLADSLRGITQGITTLIGAATEWVKHNPELITTFATLTAAAAASGVALILLGIRAKLTAAAVAATSVVYQATAIAAATAWTALVVVFNILTIKSRITSAIIRTAWVGSVTAISMAFKGLSAVMSAAFATSVMVASATVIGAVWLTTVGAISVAVFGLGTVLSTTSAVATATWTAAAGIVSSVWAASAGTIGLSWGALSAALITLASAATGAWTAGAGIMGTSLAVVEALLGVLGIEGSVAAALVGGALSAAATISSLAWTGFSAVMGVVFTWANIVAVAGFAVSAAWTAAWVAFSGPIIPIIAGLGAVAAIIGVITAKSVAATFAAADFSKSWRIVTSTLKDLMSVAQRVGGVLMDAFARGDYQTAFRAAMAGLKLVFAKAMDAMSKLWDDFWAGAWAKAKEFIGNFAQLAAKTALGTGGMASAVSGIVAKNQGVNIAPGGGMAADAEAELKKLEGEMVARKAIADKIAADKLKAEEDAAERARLGGGGMPPAAPGGGSAFGDATAQSIEGEAELKSAADEAAAAFERETESLQQQIIALRQGADAAERFRLAKEGLSAEQIDQVMGLRAQQDQIEKQQEQSRIKVRRIQDMADADYEKNGLTPAEINAKEKQSIKADFEAGRLDRKTAEEAMLEADMRQAEKEHQERLKRFRGEESGVMVGGQSVGLKSGGASAATFSAQSLLSMGTGAGQGPQVKALIETKKAIMAQTQHQQQQSEAQIAAIKQSKMKHG
jgi:TP901 family phage tail tape measure protein